MNDINKWAWAIVIDDWQFDKVAFIDASGLQHIGNDRFKGLIKIALENGNTYESFREHGQSDFLEEYGFILTTFEEMAKIEGLSKSEMLRYANNVLDAANFRAFLIKREKL